METLNSLTDMKLKDFTSEIEADEEPESPPKEYFKTRYSPTISPVGVSAFLNFGAVITISLSLDRVGEGLIIDYETFPVHLVKGKEGSMAVSLLLDVARGILFVM